MSITEYYSKPATGTSDILESEEPKSTQEEPESIQEESESAEEELESVEEQEDEMDIEMNNNGNNFAKKIEALKAILKQNKKKISAYEYLRYHSVYVLLINWKEKNMTCKEAASVTAREVFNKGLYCAKIIKKWAKSWVENGVLPVSMQGCHQKTKSFIDDEDVIEESLEFIRKNEGKITPKLYRAFINDTLLL